MYRTIQLVSAELGELHSYVVREMWRSIKETGDNASEKQPLVQVRRFIGKYFKLCTIYWASHEEYQYHPF